MEVQDFRSAKASFVALLKRDIVLAVARHNSGGKVAWQFRVGRREFILTVSGAMAA
jgi:hypothetical protein